MYKQIKLALMSKKTTTYFVLKNDDSFAKMSSKCKQTTLPPLMPNKELSKCKQRKYLPLIHSDVKCITHFSINHHPNCKRIRQCNNLGILKQLMQQLIKQMQYIGYIVNLL